MSDSFYSQFDGFEAPQTQTPHANRQDMHKPYDNGTFSQKAKDAMTESEPKTCANVSWWRWFTRQQDNNVIALKINRGFNRNNLCGDNYAQEKARYISEYNNELGR